MEGGGGAAPVQGRFHEHAVLVACTGTWTSCGTPEMAKPFLPAATVPDWRTTTAAKEATEGEEPAECPTPAGTAED